MSKVEVNTVEPQCGTTLTLGGSGDTVALGSGASQTGFGRTGTVDWVTTPKVTGDSPVTGVTGKGYFLDTTAGTITINLPAGAAGSIVSVMDYAATWNSNAVTVSPNGSEKIGGTNADVTLNTEGQSVTFVYVDSTQGWLNTMDSTSNVRANEYIVATGGTPACGTTSGDYKIHKFTGPGTFCVSAAAVCAANNLVSYMVVAGGGGGGDQRGGGGGAGGFRELVSPTAPYTASPLDGYPNAPNRITVSATPYTITVGAGAAGATVPDSPAARGSDSVFSSITSTGGGGGASHPPVDNFGLPGGSGGGIVAASPAPAGALGNTPPTTPAQGFPGGATGGGAPFYYGSGGGGATVAGSGASPTYACGTGGAGATTCISATPTAYAGGGGGGANAGPQSQLGGAGGGGNGGFDTTGGTVGTVNTGGGGGGGSGSTPAQFDGKNGGSGIVYIRYKYK